MGKFWGPWVARKEDKEPGWIYSVFPAAGGGSQAFPEHQPLRLTRICTFSDLAAGGSLAGFWGDFSASKGYEAFLIKESRDFFFTVKNVRAALGALVPL